MSTVHIQHEGAVATVTLSHPGKLNAINVAMWERLRADFTTLSRNEDLRCVIVRGSGGNFAAGADIEEFAKVRSTVEQALHYHNDVIAPALQAIADCLHPTVAAIEGVCVGGGLEIACACDLRIAAPTARFGIPINRLGFPLAPGELQGLLQLVGRARTLEILLEGRVFDAAEAKDKGLLHRIEADVQQAARTCADNIAKGAPLAARANKQLVRRLAPVVEPLSEQEMRAAFSALESQDYRDGVHSFLHKRKPVFQGK
jgi:enoyl-CoA hydratase